MHPVPFTSIKNDKVLFYFVFESRPDVHNSRWLAVRTMSVWFNETTGKFENAMLSGVRCMLEFPITIQVISVHGCFQVGQIVLGDAKITAETTTYLFSDICAKMIYGHSRASAIPLPLEGWTDGIFVSGYPGHQKYIDQVFEERTSFSEAQRMMTLLFGPQSKRKGKDLVKLELKKDNGGTNIAMNDGSVFRTAKITSHAQAMALLTIDKIASPCGQYLYCTEGKYYDKSEPKSPEETFWVKRFGTV